jgi:thioredoxin reductase (NADPH)
MNRDMVVIGSGPAGLAAALYAARANLAPLVIRGPQWGGLIATTNEVENYPGFAEPVGGFELSQQMELQAERFGAELLDELVTEVDLSVRPFRISTETSGTVFAQTLIIATGAAPQKLGVPGEEAFANRGVSYCATCDGAYFRGKRVVVVGGGNSALDEGLFLTRYVGELLIVHRRDSLRADAKLQQRALAHPQVRFLWDTAVSEILGAEAVTGLRVKNLKTGEERTLEAEGVFPYIGHLPNTELFRGQLELDARGYIVADARTRTSVAGVYAAGDVADARYRQAVIAAGEGSKAALEAIRFLDEQAHEAVEGVHLRQGALAREAQQRDQGDVGQHARDDGA